MTVEELREQLNEHIVEFGATLSGNIVDDIDSLIAAAREEGAERERERAYDYGLYLDNTSSVLSPAPKEEP